MQDPPQPRHSHSAVWDGSDSLIVFGGCSAGGGMLGDVRVLSLSTGFWSAPHCTAAPPARHSVGLSAASGAVPAPRAGHTATMCGPSTMLVFGGRDASGTFLNSIHILDTASWQWHRCDCLGPAPAPRYGHTCTALGSRLVLFGGSNASQAFDGVVYISTKLGTELAGAADELARMAGAEGGPAEADRMQAQLNQLLQRRTAQEAQQVASRKAAIAEELFRQERASSEVLQAEVEQLKLLLAEDERARQGAERALARERESAKAAAARSSERLHALSSQVQDLQASLEQAQAGAQDAEQKRRECAELLQAAREAGQAYALLQHRADALQAEVDGLTAELQHANGRCAEAETRLAAAHHASREELQRAQQGRDAERARAEQALREREAWQRRAEAAGSASAAPASRQEGFCHTASLDDSQGSGMAAEGPPAAGPLADGEQLAACLRGDSQGLGQLSLQQLLALQEQLAAGMQRLRQAVFTVATAGLRRKDDALTEAERVKEDLQTCSLCMENPKRIVLGCGHQLCLPCSAPLNECPYCRTPIQLRITLYGT